MTSPKSLLRFVTTGSVDDGKSTLIGRLLFETGSIPEDQYEAVRTTSLRRGQREADLSMLLDGLAVEREQLITIDVAYRHFSTNSRKFIIADCPGHEQYTRNMVSGASTAELAIVLIDARKGITTQTKRHGFLISLLGVPHLIVAVNKMDLIGYAEDAFRNIAGEFSEFSQKMGIHDVVFIPISALLGDNIIARSAQMPWYDGQTLLHSLENVHIASDRNLIDFRFPIQYVIRPSAEFRGYAGRIVSGTIRPGEPVTLLPSGKQTAINAIVSSRGNLDEAVAGQSITLTLKDEFDISRGDMVVRTNNLPIIGNGFEAILCWMDDRPMKLSNNYLLKHTTRSVHAHVSRLDYRIDVNTLHGVHATTLSSNEIGLVQIHAALPLFYDPYRTNRGTGSFILIDPISNNTVAAGIIPGAFKNIDDIDVESRKTGAAYTTFETPRYPGVITQEDRELRYGHKAAVIWLTGYSGSGKSTIGKILERRLFQRNAHVTLLDGDHLRHGLCSDLGFSNDDRAENIRRAAHVAKLFFDSGAIVICAFISPFASQRQFARMLFPSGRFLEVYVKCGLDVCKRRDPKGLYRKALTSEVPDFTGISSPYEFPANPEMIVETDLLSADAIATSILQRLKKEELLCQDAV